MTASREVYGGHMPVWPVDPTNSLPAITPEMLRLLDMLELRHKWGMDQPGGIPWSVIRPTQDQYMNRQPSKLPPDGYGWMFLRQEDLKHRNQMWPNNPFLRTASILGQQPLPMGRTRSLGQF